MKRIIIQIISLLSFVYTNAQQALTNNGNLQVHSGASLYLFDNFTNASSASFVNNGSFYVKGNIANAQSSMVSGTGALYLQGTAAQTISGSQKFKTYDLITNNSFGVTLNNDLSISGSHTFSSGIITTSSTPNYLIYEAGSSYAGTLSNSNHVNGWVKKIGNTNFVFPVGDNTYNRAIGLNISASSEFNVKYATPTPNTNLSDLQAPLVSIDPNEYWIIDPVSGGTATVAMNWDNTKVAFPPWQIADIRVASYNGSQWVDVGGTASGDVTTQGNITSGSVSSFSRFTFGSVTFPLPLTLLSFSAKFMGSYTALSWITVDEQNVDHFVVERSDDGNHFYSIAQLPARNSGNTEIYSTSDNAPINHIAYYRLRSVDIDGREKLSKVVVITVLNKDNSLDLAGNPVHNKIALLASADLNGSFNYTISNMSGQILQQDILTIQHGGRYEFSLRKDMLPGIYSLTVASKQQSFHYIVVVK